MSPDELTQYLHQHIPLSAAMAVSVVAITADELVVEAPLAPNINHRATVFGGSASAVGILAAWSCLHLRMRDAGVRSQLVIQRNSMDYEQPIPGDFTARASLAEPEKWPAFLKLLARHGRARIRVNAVLEYEGQAVGRLSGEFVALKMDAD